MVLTYAGAVSQQASAVIVPPVITNCCNAPNVFIDIPATESNVINGDASLTLFQPIVVNTKPAKKIISIKAELNYFEFVPGSDDCLTCNKNSATFGNFSRGSFGNIPATGAGTHEMTSNFSTTKASSLQASLTITLPPIVKCCDGVVRWCIRYIVTFEDCTVCTKVICYEKKKTANSTESISTPNNLNQ